MNVPALLELFSGKALGRDYTATYVGRFGGSVVWTDRTAIVAARAEKADLDVESIDVGEDLPDGIGKFLEAPSTKPRGRVDIAALVEWCLGRPPPATMKLGPGLPAVLAPDLLAGALAPFAGETARVFSRSAHTPVLLLPDDESWRVVVMPMRPEPTAPTPQVFTGVAP